MKLNCGPTFAVRHERRVAARKLWHVWFAWHPVRIGPEECIWLEHVERRGDYWCDPWGDGYDYEYRRLGSGDSTQ